jgi:hypothetical protein
MVQEDLPRGVVEEERLVHNKQLPPQKGEMEPLV